jgi:hypothetical protein
MLKSQKLIMKLRTWLIFTILASLLRLVLFFGLNQAVGGIEDCSIVFWGLFIIGSCFC